MWHFGPAYHVGPCKFWWRHLDPRRWLWCFFPRLLPDTWNTSIQFYFCFMFPASATLCLNDDKVQKPLIQFPTLTACGLETLNSTAQEQVHNAFAKHHAKNNLSNPVSLDPGSKSLTFHFTQQKLLSCTCWAWYLPVNPSAVLPDVPQTPQANWEVRTFLVLL